MRDAELRRLRSGCIGWSEGSGQELRESQVEGLSAIATREPGRHPKEYVEGRIKLFLKGSWKA